MVRMFSPLALYAANPRGVAPGWYGLRLWRSGQASFPIHFLSAFPALWSSETSSQRWTEEARREGERALPFATRSRTSCATPASLPPLGAFAAFCPRIAAPKCRTGFNLKHQISTEDTARCPRDSGDLSSDPKHQRQPEAAATSSRSAPSPSSSPSPHPACPAHA